MNRTIEVEQVGLVDARDDQYMSGTNGAGVHEGDDVGSLENDHRVSAMRRDEAKSARVGHGSGYHHRPSAHTAAQVDPPPLDDFSSLWNELLRRELSAVVLDGANGADVGLGAGQESFA